jgi:hypothetical protein
MLSDKTVEKRKSLYESEKCSANDSVIIDSILIRKWNWYIEKYQNAELQNLNL